MKILFTISLLAGSLSYAQDPDVIVVKNEGAITLDCDANVDGAVCPNKYASKVGLLTDTKTGADSVTSKPEANK